MQRSQVGFLYINTFCPGVVVIVITDINVIKIVLTTMVTNAVSPKNFISGLFVSVTIKLWLTRDFVTGTRWHC